MRCAILTLFILMLTMPLAVAEVGLVKVHSQEDNLLFEVHGTDVLTVQPNKDVQDTYILANGEVIASFPVMNADEIETIQIDNPGDYSIEVRSLITAEYYWEGYDIIKNDFPLELDYVAYNKNKDDLEFTFKKAQLLHPDHVATTGKTIGEKYRDFTITMNDNTDLNCYPKITTGKSLPFRCDAYSNPSTLTMTLNIGITETHEVTIIDMPAIVPPIQEPAPSIQEEPLEELQEEGDVQEVDETINQIQEDIIETLEAEQENTQVQDPVQNDVKSEDLQQTHFAIPAYAFSFFGLLFLLVVIVLLFVALHYQKRN